MKRPIFIWLCLLFSACHHNDLSLPMEPFPVEQSLKGDSVLIHDVINPGFMMLKGRSLLVSSMNSDTLLYRYSIPDFNILYRGGLKGKGPNDFQLFPMFCKTESDSIYIWGYTPLTIRCFTPSNNQSVTFSHEYALPHYESFNQMHIIRDSILIYNAIPSEYAIKKIDLKNSEELGKIPIKEDDHRESYFYSNKGIVAANNDFIVYAYTYKKQIDIYNIGDLALNKRLIGGDIEPVIRIGDFENNINYYINLIAGKHFFYALCQGEKKDYWLEKFDYEGHSIARYQCDPVPYKFDVDEVDDCLYGFNYEHEDYFYRYTFK